MQTFTIFKDALFEISCNMASKRQFKLALSGRDINRLKNMDYNKAEQPEQHIKYKRTVTPNNILVVLLNLRFD